MISVPLDPSKLFQMLLDKFYEDPTKQHNLWIDDVFVTGILAKRSGVRHRSHLKLPPKKQNFLEKILPPPQVDRVGVRLRLGGGEECERAQEEEDHVRPPRRPRQPQEQGRRGKSNQTFNPSTQPTIFP